MRNIPVVKRGTLLTGSANGCRRGDDFRCNTLFQAQFVNRRFIQTDHRAQRAGYQMKFILYNQFRSPVLASCTEKSAYSRSPWKHGKFVDRAKEQGRWIAVQFLVHHLNRETSSAVEKAGFLRAAQLKVSIIAHDISPLPDQLAISDFFNQFGSAPWAFQHLKLIVRFFHISQIADFCLGKLIQTATCFNIFVWRVAPTNPQSNGNPLFSQ